MNNTSCQRNCSDRRHVTSYLCALRFCVRGLLDFVDTRHVASSLSTIMDKDRDQGNRGRLKKTSSRVKLPPLSNKGNSVTSHMKSMEYLVCSKKITPKSRPVQAKISVSKLPGVKTAGQLTIQSTQLGCDKNGGSVSPSAVSPDKTGGRTISSKVSSNDQVSLYLLRPN